MKKEKTIKIILFVVVVACLLISLGLNLVDIMNGTRRVRTMIAVVSDGLMLILAVIESKRVIPLSLRADWRAKKDLLILCSVGVVLSLVLLLVDTDIGFHLCLFLYIISITLYPRILHGKRVSKATLTEQATAESCEVSEQSIDPGVST